MAAKTRREFILGAAAMLAATASAKSGPGTPGSAREPSIPISGLRRGAPPTFVGIQMSPHTMLDEGIEPCLDLIREKGAVNAVFPYSHAFHTASLGQPIRDLAADHGKPPRDFRGKVPLVWVRHHDEFFKNTRLRIRPADPALEFADRDLFREIADPARKRGIKVFARVLESYGRGAIENFDDVRTIDWNGEPGVHPCWSHPDYRAFWTAVVDDMFRNYDLDGFQWGAERHGPLMNIILPWNDDKDACFCAHCVARGKAAGIDAERAREGYRALYAFVRRLLTDAPKPPEGVFTVFLRHLLRYPEILAWEYQYRLAREDVQRGMYEAIKAVRPDASVGWHVSQQQSSWDIVYRAEMSYEEMAPYSDYIKLILYHGVLGPRIRSWYLERFKGTILSEIPLDRSLDLYYDLFGYDRNVEPGLDELSGRGFSPDFVYRETKRSVASAAGKTAIYSGIGIDVPDSPPDDPGTIYRATRKALEAGAGGIVISREYEEMRVPHLEAIGRAVRDWDARRPE